MVGVANMQPLERADSLRHEADVVMSLIHLNDILHPYGTIFPSGSYFLDVMVYPDIDLYLPQLSLQQLFTIAAQLASCEQVIQVVFERSDDPLRLPEGLYLKLRIKYGDWGRPWKIDMWSLPESAVEERMAEMDHFNHGMTPTLREQIIRYKLSILTSQKRTPMYSGYSIYKAFVDEGLTDEASVTDYLITHGVQIEPPRAA